MPDIGLGCNRLGSLGNHGVRLVHEAVDLGVTVFDTADAYGGGSSERLLGSAIRRYRDRVFIATKVGYVFQERNRASIMARQIIRPATRALQNRVPEVGAAAHSRFYRDQDFSPDYLRRAVEGSLSRLRTDYVDLLQLHGPRSLPSGISDLVFHLREEGKIRRFGVGLETLDGAQQWVESGMVDQIQVPFGILDPGAGREVIPAASRASVDVWVRSIFRSILLRRASKTVGSDAHIKGPRIDELKRLAESEGVSCLQLAAWFVTAQNDVSTALIGTTSLAHLREGVDMSRLEPPQAILAKLEQIATSWMEDA